MTSQCYNQSHVERRKEEGSEGKEIHQYTGLGQTKVSIVKPADSMEQSDLRLS